MMQNRTISFEQKIKENIKNYTIRNLLPLDKVEEYFKLLLAEFGVEILLTDRHGIHEVMTGDWSEYQPDVVAEPGVKVRVQNRTIGHLYSRYDSVPAQKQPAAESFTSQWVGWMAAFAEEKYLQKEASAYADELEVKQDQERQQNKYREKEDALTGVFNKSYLVNRINILERAEVVPVAVIDANINDWKFVYDNYGVDQSDSLIQLAASILMKEAKPEYIIGRVGGDDFRVLIPLVEEGEAEEYCDRVQKACAGYKESVFAVSIAMGISYKTNVEEKFLDKFSDAEYEMFNNKLELKNSEGYQERLHRGLQK